MHDVEALVVDVEHLPTSVLVNLSKLAHDCLREGADLLHVLLGLLCGKALDLLGVINIKLFVDSRLRLFSKL